MDLIQSPPSQVQKTKFQVLSLLRSQCRGLPFGQAWMVHGGLPVSSHSTDGNTEAERETGYSMSI